MRRYDDLHDPSRAKGWLFAIATNAWRDRMRARGREVRTVPIDGLAPDSDEFSLFQTLAIEDPFPYSDELHLDFLRLFRDEDVQAVFGSITPAFRLPILLTVVHGFSCKEAAAILDIPLGTLLSDSTAAASSWSAGWDYAVANGLVTTTDEDAHDRLHEAVRRMWAYLDRELERSRSPSSRPISNMPALLRRARVQPPPARGWSPTRTRRRPCRRSFGPGSRACSPMRR